MTATVDPGRDLSPAQCQDRLRASRHGFLSCTRYAMPLVVPVDLACSDALVLVTVHDRRVCGPLAGHVVALTVAGRSRGGRLGWAVAAVGRLLPAEDGGLAFHAASLQGWTFAAPVAPTLPVRSAARSL